MKFIAAAEMLTIYGLTLMICGALAYQSSGLASNALSAIFMGNGGAVVSFLLAAGTRDLALKKGERGYKTMMIAVHLAFIFPLLFGGVIAWRLFLAWNIAHKSYLKPYFSIIVFMSLVTAAVMYSKKPKKEEKKEKIEEQSTKESPADANTNVRRRRRAAAM